MARAIKAKAAENIYTCRECSHSFDWCHKSVDNHLICCRCDFKKFYHFLSDKSCANFKLRTDADPDEQI